MAPSTKTIRPGASAALEAEAAEEKYVTFTVEIGGEEIDLTVVRDPQDLPRSAMRLLGRRDPIGIADFIDVLLGEDQCQKIDSAGATVQTNQDILEKWSEESGVDEGK